jgi:hypothetical protein
MVSALIFALHGIAAFIGFFRYKKEGFGDGLLAVGFMAIIFAVGWTIATMLTNLLFTPDWFIKWYYQPLDSFFWLTVRKEINRDAISLMILTAGEIGFYYAFLGESFRTSKRQDSSKT